MQNSSFFMYKFIILNLKKSIPHEPPYDSLLL